MGDDGRMKMFAMCFGDIQQGAAFGGTTPFVKISRPKIRIESLDVHLGLPWGVCTVDKGQNPQLFECPDYALNLSSSHTVAP